jgi:UDP-glucose 4-epimerase
VGNLEPKRDYIFIDDVVNALMLITKTLNSNNCIFDVYNVGTGVSYSVREVIETLGALVNKKINYMSVTSKKRKFDRPNLSANVDKLKRLGWKPTYDLYKGLKKYLDDPGNLEWFKTNKDKLLK